MFPSFLPIKSRQTCKSEESLSPSSAHQECPYCGLDLHSSCISVLPSHDVQLWPINDKNTCHFKYMEGS